MFPAPALPARRKCLGLKEVVEAATAEEEEETRAPGEAVRRLLLEWSLRAEWGEEDCRGDGTPKERRRGLGGAELGTERPAMPDKFPE